MEMKYPKVGTLFQCLTYGSLFLVFPFVFWYFLISRDYKRAELCSAAALAHLKGSLEGQLSLWCDGSVWIGRSHWEWAPGLGVVSPKTQWALAVWDHRKATSPSKNLSALFSEAKPWTLWLLFFFSLPPHRQTVPKSWSPTFLTASPAPSTAPVSLIPLV